ncbi:hypothetical protein BIY24_12500 [Halobacteriovorax marinus]|uniref:Uncharacterized protein n=1 Tax=Halobacteriovorax marinus (strain ATCC BAA-682 / DSM 15412 / SJ) TaxID=862908 RepID=E1X689_HALMS|nr:hypothetical protein [Halobacteriovorax marinus]ATH08737.1 hypothetical protein BIY24_12500 [Halobacteriovorax marinus]CBW27434.1 hypothetical protein BMS_2652 [Halobacteriovorax marinus SJ]
MEDTKLDEAIEETAEQSFNDSELEDIMSEIESLEKEFVEDGERTPEELAIVSAKKTDLQSAIDEEVESIAQEMSPEETMEQTQEIVAEASNEIEDDFVSESEVVDNVVSLPTAEKPATTSTGAAMGFAGEGTMNFNLNFKIGEESATLKVDGDKGLSVEMGGVTIAITEESGCTVTMDGGVNFNIPLTTTSNAATKKAA